jgi:hypothetical protein
MTSRQMRLAIKMVALSSLTLTGLALLGEEPDSADAWTGYSPPGEAVKITRLIGQGIAGYAEDEKRRKLQRPDIVRVVGDQRELTADQVFKLLKENPGKQVVWFHLKTYKEFGDSYEIAEHYVLAPRVSLDDLAKAWRADTVGWRELLIQPPIGSWIEVRDGPTSSYSGPWGAGQRVYDGLFARIWETTQELQNEEVAKPDGLVHLRIQDYRGNERPEDRVVMLSDPDLFNSPFSWSVERIDGQVVLKTTKKFTDGVSRRLTWWSGSKLISLRGERLGRATDVVKRYLAKHPSTLAVAPALTAESWLLDFLDYATERLEVRVESGDLNMGELDPVNTFEFVVHRIASPLAETKAIGRWHDQVRQELRQEHLADKKFDWLPYRDQLYALRRETLAQVREVLVLVRKRGIRYNDDRLVFEIRPE